MAKLVIAPYKPLRIAVAIVLLSMAFALAAWSLFDNTHWRYIHRQMAQAEQNQQLWEINRSLEAQNRKLRERLVVAEANSEIDRNTTAALQKDVERLQDELYRRTRELEFYRGIVSATKDSEGLKVQGLLLETLSQSGHYRFKLVLTQVAKNDKVAEGTVKVTVHGQQNGAARTFALQDLVQDAPVNLEYRFKHFKRFEGLLRLPEDFQPDSILVQLYPKDKSQAMVERVFDWSQLTG
jgi:hypothetical protein